MDNVAQLPNTSNPTDDPFSDENMAAFSAAYDAQQAAPPKPKDRLRRNAKDALISCSWNAQEILATSPEWQGVLAFDELSNSVVFTKDPPGREDHFPSYQLRKPLGDVVWHGISGWLQRHHGIVVTPAVVYHAADLVARKSSYHPIKSVLDGLRWDGVRRLDTWLIDLFRVEDTQLTRAISRKWLIAGVARVNRPGCKVDTMLILEGPKGWGKSSVFRALGEVAGDYFSDTHLDMGTKDRFEQIQGVFLYEFSELDGFDRADTSRLKGFLSSQTDKYRRPFGATISDLPRQVLFAGSTNKNEYIREDHERRFWPVRIQRRLSDADKEKFRAVVPQLWAEAVAAYRAGEVWYLDGVEEETLAQAQQSRVVSDVMETAVCHYILETKQAGDLISTEEVMDHLSITATSKDAKAQSMRIGDILRKYSDGTEKRRVSISGKRVPCYTVGPRLFAEVAAELARGAASTAPAEDF